MIHVALSFSLLWMTPIVNKIVAFSCTAAATTTPTSNFAPILDLAVIIFAMMIYSGNLLIIVASCIGIGSVWATAASATSLLNIGRGLAMMGYILVLIVTAIIWGLQASWQVVYLSDFFYRPPLQHQSCYGPSFSGLVIK
jgi:hypothetical protein